MTSFDPHQWCQAVYEHGPRHRIVSAIILAMYMLCDDLGRVSLTRRELADQVGVTPKTLRKYLCELETEGWIENDGRWLRLAPVTATGRPVTDTTETVSRTGQPVTDTGKVVTDTDQPVRDTTSETPSLPPSPSSPSPSSPTPPTPPTPISPSPNPSPDAHAETSQTQSPEQPTLTGVGSSTTRTREADVDRFEDDLIEVCEAFAESGHMLMPQHVEPLYEDVRAEGIPKPARWLVEKIRLLGQRYRRATPERMFEILRDKAAEWQPRDKRKSTHDPAKSSRFRKEDFSEWPQAESTPLE